MAAAPMLIQKAMDPDPSEEPASAHERQDDGRPAPDLDEHVLIRRAQEGDEDAFAKLVERHRGRAWRVARNLVPNAEDASDLVQDAFLRVFRNLERFDHEHEFCTWLYRIVTNLAIDHLRKRRPTLSTASGEDDAPELDLPDEGAPLPSAGLERSETAAEVRACIDALAPHFQTVLVLRELEGLPCTEIAGIVGATHVTVRWRLHRGRKLFQEEWERRARLQEQGLSPESEVQIPAEGNTNISSPPAVDTFHKTSGLPGQDGPDDDCTR